MRGVEASIFLVLKEDLAKQKLRPWLLSAIRGGIAGVRCVGYIIRLMNQRSDEYLYFVVGVT